MARNGKSRTAPHPGLTRTRYFPRRLVTATDLTADQDYLRERLRRHNRYLHGCGIVCGLEVGAGMIDSLPVVIVTPGYALSPQGEDIHVPTEQRLAIDKVLSVDCSRLEAVTFPVNIWVAVRYREEEVDHIPALPERCAPTTRCEPSRIRADFEMALLDVQPPEYPPLPGCADLLDELHRRGPRPGLPPPVPPAAQCPPAVDDPWVVLAKVEITRDPAGPLVFSVDYRPRAPRIFSAVLLGSILWCLPRRPLSRPVRVAQAEPANGSVFTLPNRPSLIATVFDNDVLPETVTNKSMLLKILNPASGQKEAVAGAVSYEASIQAAVFTPASQLVAGTYFIQVLGDGVDTVRDFEGQRLDGDANGIEGGDFESTFELVIPRPARVTRVEPRADTVFRLPDGPTRIAVVFDQDVVLVAGSMVLEIQDAAGRRRVAGTASYDPAQRTAVFTPSALLNAAGIYFIQAFGDGAAAIRGSDDGLRLDGDNDGREGGDFQSFFQLVPPVQPARVVQVVPPDGAVPLFPPSRIEVEFDQDVDPETITSVNVALHIGNDIQFSSHSYDPQRRTVVLSPLNPNLPRGVTYFIRVLGDRQPDAIEPVRDRFEQEIDGDNDGRPGGDFQSSFFVPRALKTEVEKALRDNGFTDAEALAAHDRHELAKRLDLTLEDIDELQRAVRQRKEDE